MRLTGLLGRPLPSPAQDSEGRGSVRLTGLLGRPLPSPAQRRKSNGVPQLLRAKGEKDSGFPTLNSEKRGNGGPLLIWLRGERNVDAYSVPVSPKLQANCIS